MTIQNKHPGHVLRRETVNGKHQKHVVVQTVRVRKCDICGKKCKDKVIQTQTTGNVRIATCCMECGEVEYGAK